LATSPLLTLARDSILEVLQAENIINRDSLLKRYPILEQKALTQVAIYINDEIFGYSTSLKNDKTLLESIVFNAKSAAFFGKRVLSSSEYLHSEIEVSILTLDESIREFNNSEFLKYLNSNDHGIILFNSNTQIEIPSHINASNIDDFFSDSNLEFNVNSFQIYTLEKARDSAILGD